MSTWPTDWMRQSLGGRRASERMRIVAVAVSLVFLLCYNVVVVPLNVYHNPNNDSEGHDFLGQRSASPCDESNVYPMTETCNCITTTVLDGWGGTCCSRTLRHAHKMGNHMARSALTREIWSNLRIATDTFRYTEPAHDYRDVIVVRDLFSTIVSGYLYHKKGHECWLDAIGRPTNTSTINAQWWETIRTVMPFPVRRKRSLCQYLADESEEHGLHLYMHMSLYGWFQHIAAQYAFSQTVSDRNRTMFVCFDELSSVDEQDAALRRMIEHFWPGGHNFRMPKRPSNVSSYAGAHSTQDVAADYKASLREKAVELDQQYYKGEVARINALFNCGQA